MDEEEKDDDDDDDDEGEDEDGDGDVDVDDDMTGAMCEEVCRTKKKRSGGHTATAKKRRQKERCFHTRTVSRRCGVVAPLTASDATRRRRWLERELERSNVSGRWQPAVASVQVPCRRGGWGIVLRCAA